jgi:hypothetical protein
MRAVRSPGDAGPPLAGRPGQFAFLRPLVDTRQGGPMEVEKVTAVVRVVVGVLAVVAMLALAL